MSHVAKKSNTKAKQNIESGIRGNFKVTHPGRGQGFRLRRRNYRARRAEDSPETMLLPPLQSLSPQGSVYRVQSSKDGKVHLALYQYLNMAQLRTHTLPIQNRASLRVTR